MHGNICNTHQVHEVRPISRFISKTVKDMKSMNWGGHFEHLILFKSTHMHMQRIKFMILC